MVIHTYDASLEERSSVRVTVSKHLTQATIDNLLELKSHKLEILVENMGRTNIGWDIKKLRKGNICRECLQRYFSLVPDKFTSHSRY